VTTPIVCRVCGRDFEAPRWDARTCSSTCRQRLHRGKDLAYLAELGDDQKEADFRMHAAWSKAVAAGKEASAARKRVRELNRERRTQRAAEEHERTIASVLGMEQLRKMEEEQTLRALRTRGTVASCVKLFTQQGREITAEAIVTFVDHPEFSADMVAVALDQLRASGDYELIVADER